MNKVLATLNNQDLVSTNIFVCWISSSVDI